MQKKGLSLKKIPLFDYTYKCIYLYFLLITWCPEKISNTLKKRITSSK